jgi:uncharacterized protein (DUF924 family)
VSEITPEDVLAFWFEEASPDQWFGGGPAFDATVRRRFSKLVFGLTGLKTVAGHPWLDGPERALALILALDQFPRNIWRGTPKAFSLDPLGLEAARTALEAGWDLRLDAGRRAFVYMPFMHSEALADQELCVSLSETRIGETSDTAHHAREHRDVIARFGRFPHRNSTLERPSTASEIAFLSSGGYNPGAPDPANSA